MAIPEFNNRGTLESGIHQCNSEEFINRFCYGEKTIRSKYINVLQQLFAYSMSRGGTSILIGGSFVTSKESPNDIDCIIILPNERCCDMQSNELLSVEGCQIDVLVVAESKKNNVYDIINMFSRDKYDIEVGLVQILLDSNKDQSTWNDFRNYFSFEKLLKAREAYINRHVIRAIGDKKLFVTLLNINEFFLFNYDVSPIISNAGWIFAPFVYTNEDFESNYKRFYDWILEMDYTYETEVCIYADGLGCVILGRYLVEETNYKKVSFDRILMTRACLIKNFDWNSIIDNRRAQKIINLNSIDKNYQVSEKIHKTYRESGYYEKLNGSGFNDKNNVKEIMYNYERKIKIHEFISSIFPLYQISKNVEKNIENAIFESIYNIKNMDIKTSDLILK